MTLRQKQPRIEYPAYLAYVRTQPCMICARPGSDAAHIRTGSLVNKKPHTGFGEKPDDKWALPLCRDHHREQHSMNERAFWRRYGINPFLAAIRLYRNRPAMPPSPTPKPFSARATKQRKPADKRKGIPARVDPWPQGRTLTSRNDLRKATP